MIVIGVTTVQITDAMTCSTVMIDMVAVVATTTAAMTKMVEAIKDVMTGSTVIDVMTTVIDVMTTIVVIAVMTEICSVAMKVAVVVVVHREVAEVVAALPLDLLTLLVRFAQSMVIQQRTVGGVTLTVVMTMRTTLALRRVHMELIPTGIWTVVLQITSLGN
jgi:hypothetical protein